MLLCCKMSWLCMLYGTQKVYFWAKIILEKAVSTQTNIPTPTKNLPMTMPAPSSSAAPSTSTTAFSPVSTGGAPGATPRRREAIVTAVKKEVSHFHSLFFPSLQASECATGSRHPSWKDKHQDIPLLPQLLTLLNREFQSSWASSPLYSEHNQLVTSLTMVAGEHRTLNPEQRSIYLQGIQQAYTTALQYSSSLYASETGFSEEQLKAWNLFISMHFSFHNHPICKWIPII